MNAWLKMCVFNLDLNRESVSEPRTLSRRDSSPKKEKLLLIYSPPCYPRCRSLFSVEQKRRILAENKAINDS